jgi:DNA-binding transcriptional LysR family regulator
VELRYLRYFVAVAEELSFTRAAERLNIAQPPLSQQIRRLEARLGVTLLRRSKRRVELTEAGRVFLRQAYQAIQSLEEGILLAQRADRGEIGRLAVGILVYISYTLIPPILREFRAQFPEVHVELRFLTNTLQIAALLSGQVDVCFVRPPIDNPDIASKLISRERFILAMPATHPLAGKAAVSIKQFKNDPFIMYVRELGPTFCSSLVQFCARAGFSPKVALEVSQINAAVGLVGAGIGVALVPQSMDQLHFDNVVYRPLIERAPNVDVLLAWQAGRPSELLKSFIEMSAQFVRVSTRPGAGSTRL